MRNGRLLLAALAAATLVIGCGSGSDATDAISKSDFIARANAICADGTKELDKARSELGVGENGNPAPSSSRSSSALLWCRVFRGRSMRSALWALPRGMRTRWTRSLTRRRQPSTRFPPTRASSPTALARSRSRTSWPSTTASTTAPHRSRAPRPQYRSVERAVRRVAHDLLGGLRLDHADTAGADVVQLARDPRPLLHLWYRFGTDRYVRCVQIVQKRGRIGRSGRSRTHRRPEPVGWGPKGRWFKSSRPD